MRKVFLDVGGHLGQTIDEVIKPLYAFDVIYCFEPFPPCADILTDKFDDPRFQLMRYGLSNTTGPLTFHTNGAGDMGASVKTHADDQKTIKTECQFVRATEFFQAHIADDDLVVMKLNCEGSECDIMNDLMDSGEVFKIDNVMIDFDVRKYPNHAHEEPALKARMAEIGFNNFSLCEEVMRGGRGHQGRIASWLRSIPWHDRFRPRAGIAERVRSALRL
ncbi:FkbM family methyltransferase [Tateyamaria sp. SN6-1]|uniref:FkbM family methyltransferase n=1 Tax=Tateyamaria sp. SN6-1 TaxID=3092148 RepID=UPI0039F4AE8F